VPKHIFTIDLEDWFHVISPQAPKVDTWEQQEPRVKVSTEKILSMLERFETRATFFVLGWIAERYPELVREIDRRGHEIANHGYQHLLLSELNADSFRKDLKRAEQAIVSCRVRRPVGFRAPSYSLTPRTAWAWKVLADAGYRYDASIFPCRRHNGGWPKAPHQPYLPLPKDTLWEIPISAGRLGSYGFVFSAGGYLRLMPQRLINYFLRRLEKRGKRAVFVLHPKDVDPQVPSAVRGTYARLRQQLHIGSTEEKVKYLLAHFSFTTMIDTVTELERERKG
jgi:polysaccharide deacetylase family protein (PEP-CTERM system associated)